VNDFPLKVPQYEEERGASEQARPLTEYRSAHPAAIDKQIEFGHWEIDTVIGKTTQVHAFMTLTERII